MATTSLSFPSTPGSTTTGHRPARPAISTGLSPAVFQSTPAYNQQAGTPVLVTAAGSSTAPSVSRPTSPSTASPSTTSPSHPTVLMCRKQPLPRIRPVQLAMWLRQQDGLASSRLQTLPLSGSPWLSPWLLSSEITWVSLAVFPRKKSISNILDFVRAARMISEEDNILTTAIWSCQSLQVRLQGSSRGLNQTGNHNIKLGSWTIVHSGL